MAAKKSTKRASKKPAKKSTKRSTKKTETVAEPTHAVETELLKATKQKPIRAKESRQGFLKRIVRAVAKLDEDAWESLSVEAQTWNNEAATRLKARKPVPDFTEVDYDAAEDEADDGDESEEDEDEEDDGDESEEDEDDGDEDEEEEAEEEEDDGDEDEEEEEEEEEAPKPKRKAKASKKSTKAPKAEKKAKKKKAKRGRSSTARDTASSYFRKFQIENPAASLDECMDAVVAAEYSPLTKSTARATHWHTRHTLLIMKEMDLYDGDVG